jgi:hypothetical protein
MDSTAGGGIWEWAAKHATKGSDPLMPMVEIITVISIIRPIHA